MRTEGQVALPIKGRAWSAALNAVPGTTVWWNGFGAKASSWAQFIRQAPPRQETCSLRLCRCGAAHAPQSRCCKADRCESMFTAIASILGHRRRLSRMVVCICSLQQLFQLLAVSLTCSSYLFLKLLSRMLKLLSQRHRMGQAGCLEVEPGSRSHWRTNFFTPRNDSL